MKGHCTVHVENLHVANLYELDIFGEGVIANTNELPTLRSATVLAAEDVEVLALTRNELTKLITTNVLDTKTVEQLSQMMAARNKENKISTQAKATDALKNCPLFASLTEKKRSAIVDMMKIKTFEKEETLFKQGDSADHMYLIMAGSCDVIIGKKTAATLRKFDIFGEAATLTLNKRNATVQVVSEKMEVLMLSREDLEMLAQSKALDNKCLEDLEKMSTTRANKNKSIKQMDWRDHVRLRTVFDEEEIIVIDSDDEEEEGEEGQGNEGGGGELKKGDEEKEGSEEEAKSGTTAEEGGQNKGENDNKKVTSSRIVPLVGKKTDLKKGGEEEAIGFVVKIHAEDEQTDTEEDNKTSSIGDEKGRNDDMADLKEHSVQITKKRKLRKLGSSMRRILVNQMQILSAIFPSITWSRFLPPALIQMIAGIAAIFTVDFSALFTSPECGADSTRRGQWVIRVCIPIFLAFCLLVWAGVAKCCLSKRPIRQRATLVRIARIAVRLLLLGLYKTAVESSIQILNCENIDGKVSTVVGGGVCSLAHE
jgi:CRP-like cAMP-binding protein